MPKPFLSIVFPLLFASLLSDSNFLSAQSISSATVPPDFKGKYLLAISDADMVASAYIDSLLGSVTGKDELTIIPFSPDKATTSISTLPVTNSVTGPPASIAVSPDGRYAIVIETRGARPVNKSSAIMDDMAKGHAITVINITDPAKPHVVQVLQGGERPVSVCFNTTGNRVAIAYTSFSGKQASLVLYQFNEGKLSSATAPTIPGWQATDELTDVSFYGKDSLLALLNIGNATLSFYRVIDSGSYVTLRRWGNVIPVDKAPFLIRFTPDGRYAICNSMFVDSTQRSTIISIRIAATQAADGSPIHQVVSKAYAGGRPEGIAISPDGQWVATANLERSYEPLHKREQSFYSSISLLHLNGAGQLERAGDFCFSGILPETVVFDNSSRYIAVTTFDHYKDMPAGGSVDFWCIRPDMLNPKRVELIKTGYTVPVQRGVHSMVLVR